MGKFIVGLLATLAAVWLVVCLFGASKMASTAVDVPATEHTHSFAVTWTVVAFGVCGLLVWRLVKGK